MTPSKPQMMREARTKLSVENRKPEVAPERSETPIKNFFDYGV